MQETKMKVEMEKQKGREREKEKERERENMIATCMQFPDKLWTDFGIIVARQHQIGISTRRSKSSVVTDFLRQFVEINKKYLKE
jgi:hypothetical protein